MKSRAYRAVAVNRVDAAKLIQGHEGQAVSVGVDVGKYELQVVARWPDGQFEHPWKVANPSQIAELVGLLKQVSQGRTLHVALESSGTYGDALRQAAHDAGIEVRRVSSKARVTYGFPPCST